MCWVGVNLNGISENDDASKRDNVDVQRHKISEKVNKFYSKKDFVRVVS